MLMKNNILFVLLFLPCISIGMEEGQEKPLSELLEIMQKHAKQFDMHHAITTINLIQRVWAVNYIADMLKNGKNKNNEDRTYGAWRAFTDWYTHYMQQKVASPHCDFNTAYRRPLTMASEENNTGMLRIFKKLGIPYDPLLYSMYNPLLYAKSVYMAQTLITDFNVSVDAVNLSKEPLIMVSSEDDEIPSELISLYIKHTIDIQKTDSHERNALHVLARFSIRDLLGLNSDSLDNRLEKACILINAGIDCKARDKNNSTPLQIAQHSRKCIMDDAHLRDNKKEIDYYDSLIKLIEEKNAESE